MVSDDDMASGSMDHIDRDDDYRLILLTAKCVDTYIDGSVQELSNSRFFIKSLFCRILFYNTISIIFEFFLLKLLFLLTL